MNEKKIMVLPEESKLALERIIPTPDKHMTIGDRIKILDTSLELYTGAIDKCNAAEISRLATKIGVFSSVLREELSPKKDDLALKSLVDLNIIEKKFRNQHNRLLEGHCKCKMKGTFLPF